MADHPLAILSLALFVSAIYAAVLLPVAAVARLALTGWTDPWAWTTLVVLLLLAVLPLQWFDGARPRAIMGRICASACTYFPIKVVVEDEDALKPGTPYVLGYEPHSALPIGIPAVFAVPSPALPKFLRGDKFHSLASGVCFVVPLVRQLWWWLGLRPATRADMSQILTSGGSVLLCPGGVQECLHMTPGNDLVFLRKRKGFVRMAIQHGAHLVPVFAFGQGGSYGYYRPGPPFLSRSFVEWFSRKAGAVPIVIHGRWMTPVPKPAPMTIVVGKPIAVPHIATPSDEVIEQYLGSFIKAMEQLYERHKSTCGFSDAKLQVM